MLSLVQSWMHPGAPPDPVLVVALVLVWLPVVDDVVPPPWPPDPPVLPPEPLPHAASSAIAPSAAIEKQIVLAGIFEPPCGAKSVAQGGARVQEILRTRRKPALPSRIVRPV
jgi:hypothetical protein